MKLRTIIILLAVLVNNAFAQTSKDICSSSTISSWNAKPASLTTVSDAKNMIADIIAVIGLKQNFEVMAANVDNAAAVIYNSKRYILYNPDFINRLNTLAGNKWASISILAHETGHHLNGHTLDKVGSQPDKELEADEFSGFVLRRMGATLKEAQAAMKIAADYKRSLTHPGQAERLIAIANGWNTADKQQGGKDLAKVNMPKPEQNNVYRNDNVQPQNNQSQKDIYVRTSNDQNANRRLETGNDRSGEKGIVADVVFAADEYGTYYVTSNYKVVKQMNNRLYTIGQLASNDHRSYPLTISDDAGTKLWIDTAGNIVNANNKIVGILKVRK